MSKSRTRKGSYDPCTGCGILKQNISYYRESYCRDCDRNPEKNLYEAKFTGFILSKLIEDYNSVSIASTNFSARTESLFRRIYELEERVLNLERLTLLKSPSQGEETSQDNADQNPRSDD